MLGASAGSLLITAALPMKCGLRFCASRKWPQPAREMPRPGPIPTYPLARGRSRAIRQHRQAAPASSQPALATCSTAPIESASTSAAIRLSSADMTRLIIWGRSSVGTPAPVVNISLRNPAPHRRDDAGPPRLSAYLAGFGSGEGRDDPFDPSRLGPPLGSPADPWNHVQEACHSGARQPRQRQPRRVRAITVTS